MKRAKTLTVLMLAVLLMLSLVACGGGETSSTPAPVGSAPAGDVSTDETGADAGPEKIMLGYIGPLTGEMAIYGEAESNTIKMLVEETNANGGLLGKTVEVKYYDNRGDAVETTNAARKAVQDDKVVAFIGCNTSSASLTLAEICEENQIPMVATCATNYSVTQRDDGSVRDYVFRMVLSDPQIAEVMAYYAYDVMDLKSAAILYEVSSDYSAGLTENFTDAYEARGGAITMVEAYKTGDVDFRSQLSKIKNAGGYDTIFLPALYKELGLIANQARDLGITEQFIGPDCWMMEDLFTIAKDTIDGGVFPCAMDVNSTDLLDFKAAYEEKYGNDPGQAGTNAFFAYDIYLLLCDAIERAGVVDSTKIRDEIEKTTDLKGLTSSITMDPTTHNPIREATIFEIKEAQFVAIDTYMPQ